MLLARSLALLIALAPVQALAQAIINPQTNATNLITGTLPSARLTGSYTGVTGTGTLTAGATGSGFTVALATSTMSGTLPSANISGSYTGITGTGTLTAGATGAGFTVALGTSTITGTLSATNGGTGVGSLGTGVATALGVNVGSAGAFTTFNGAGGTPSSITLTNGTGLPIAGTTGYGTGVATALAVNVSSSGAFLTESSTGTLTNKTLNSAASGNVLQVSGVTVSRGQSPGTSTNDNATAGNKGEYAVSGLASYNTCCSTATITVTIASPGVVTWTTNPFFDAGALNNGCASVVSFTNSGGALPTGIVSGTAYYVTCDGTFTANAFHISSSVANAIAGTAINTSGSQSGTQTGRAFVAITSNVDLDIAGLSLTAGDWDLQWTPRFIPAASASVTIQSAYTNSATVGGGTYYNDYRLSTGAQVPASFTQIPSQPVRVSLSGTSSVFCTAGTTFSIGTMTVTGQCRARRVR